MSGQQILMNAMKANKISVKDRKNVDAACVAHYEKRIGDAQIKELLAKSRENVDIEVSWALGLVTKQLKEVFPQCKIVGMVKNGESVVRMYKRMGIFDYYGDMIFKDWGVDEFSRYCFIWNSFNDYMQVDEWLRYEDMTPEKISEIVERKVSFKVNGMVELEFPKFDEGEVRVFEKICGKMMRRFEYV